MLAPDGSNIYYCHKKNIRMPVPVEYDTCVNGQVVTCLSKSSVRYRSFNVCCHTVAVANRLNVLSTLILKLNAKSTTEQALILQMAAETKTVEKNQKNAAQKRKGPSSNKKIAKLLPFPDTGELELSQPLSNSRRHANTVSAKPDLQQSQILFYNFLHLRILLSIFRQQQDSFQGVTVPQPMPNIVPQTSQQRYLANQNLTSYATFRNPPRIRMSLP